MSLNQQNLLRAALPTGRPEAALQKLLEDAGIGLETGGRSYRPRIALDAVDVKCLKPRTVAEMLAADLRDLGFTGADWAFESGGEIVELCDTGLDKVRIVAAAPPDIVRRVAAETSSQLRVASEYRRLTLTWAKCAGRPIEFIESRGTTEVLPPEDADVIVDSVSTGQTLAANNLIEFDEVFQSSTRMYASAQAMVDASKRNRIENLAVMIRAACAARSRVMLELNCPCEQLDRLLQILPAMRSPTISRLSDKVWFSVKTSVLRADLPKLIPQIKQIGGADLVVSQPFMVIP